MTRCVKPRKAQGILPVDILYNRQCLQLLCQVMIYICTEKVFASLRLKIVIFKLLIHYNIIGTP